MDTYYFVVCEHRPKGEAGRVPASNHILKNTHPLVWGAHPPTAFAAHFVTYILFWIEIPEAIAGDPDVFAYFDHSY